MKKYVDIINAALGSNVIAQQPVNGFVKQYFFSPVIMCSYSDIGFVEKSFKGWLLKKLFIFCDISSYASSDAKTTFPETIFTSF